MLEDLIAAALNDARTKADAAAGDRDAGDDERACRCRRDSSCRSRRLAPHRSYARHDARSADRWGGERVKLGAMQDWPLRVMRLVDHAEREHGDGEIVTAWGDGTITRTNWARRRQGRAADGAGARTAGHQARRPRRHAGDEPQPPSDVLVRRDRDGRDPPHHQPAPVRRPARLYRQPCRGPGPALRPRLRAGRRADEAAAGRRSSIISASIRPPASRDFAEWIAAEDGDYAWVEGDERDPCGLCYTSGTTGNPKGVLYEHRSTMIHTMAEVAPDIFDLSVTLGGAADRADVPRQRLGHPVGGADDRVQAGAVGRLSPGADVRPVPRREGHAIRPACRPSGSA